MAVDRPVLRMVAVLAVLTVLSLAWSWWRGDSLATSVTYVVVGLVAAGLVYAAWVWVRRKD